MRGGNALTLALGKDQVKAFPGCVFPFMYSAGVRACTVSAIHHTCGLETLNLKVPERASMSKSIVPVMRKAICKLCLTGSACLRAVLCVCACVRASAHARYRANGAVLIHLFIAASSSSQVLHSLFSPFSPKQTHTHNHAHAHIYGASSSTLSCDRCCMLLHVSTLSSYNPH